MIGFPVDNQDLQASTVPLCFDELSLSVEDILDALSDAILIVKASGKVIWANLAAEHLFMSGRNKLAASNLVELMGNNHPILDLLGQIHDRSSTIARDIVIASFKTKQEHKADIQINPLKIGESEPYYIITIRPIMSNHLQHWQKNMQQQQPLDFMRSVLSHELRNPLAGIRGAAQLLSKDIDDEQKDLTHLILDETDRINRFIEELHKFDAPESEYRVFNIHKALNIVTRNLKTQWPYVHIIQQFDPSLPEIYGHEDSLVRVFLNIARNSVEAFGESEGTITLRTYWKQNVRLKHSSNLAFEKLLPIIIEIEDNGQGIAEDIYPNIFKPFVSSKKSSRGLGLALAEKTIHDHQAVISCSSRPGKTIFTIKFPMYNKQTLRKNHGI